MLEAAITTYANLH